jgi:bifunctional enzyme CysN/CysC
MLHPRRRVDQRDGGRGDDHRPDDVTQVAEARPGPGAGAGRRPGAATRTAAGTRPGGATGATVWLTGLSGAGKSTIADGLAAALVARGAAAVCLDGDDLRRGLNADLGFTAEDRAENIRRVGEVSRLFAANGHLTLVSLISPFQADRDKVRARHAELGIPFVLVHVSTSLRVCEERDPKGLYALARRGEIDRFTGVSDPYEAPTSADVIVDTEGRSPLQSTGEVLAALESMRLVPRPML